MRPSSPAPRRWPPPSTRAASARPTASTFVPSARSRSPVAASRLEHLARAHDASIVASAETLAAAVNSGGFGAADSKHFRPVGAVQVPGRGEPVEVFVVPISNVTAR
jgi:hypothetical protein